MEFSRERDTLVIDTQPVTRPTRTYSPNVDSAERAEPFKEMETIAEPHPRKRGVLSQSTNNPRADTVSTRISSTTLVGSTRSVSSVGPWLKQYFDTEDPKKLEQKEEEEKAKAKQFGYDKFKLDRVDPVPDGIPKLARFQNSNNDFSLTRRFGQLSFRILCRLQTRLTKLEEELDELDMKDRYHDDLKHRLRGYEDYEGWDDTQQKLEENIAKRLSEYFSLTLQVRQMSALGQPPKTHVLSLFNWAWSKKPLGKPHDNFLHHVDDFVSLGASPESKTRPYRLLDWYMNCNPDSYLKKILQTKEERELTKDPNVYHLSAERFDLVGRIVLIVLTGVALIAPILLLVLVSIPRKYTAPVIALFVLLFLVLIVTITDAKPHEIMVGAAAYGAVLTTFVGNMEPVGNV